MQIDRVVDVCVCVRVCVYTRLAASRVQPLNGNVHSLNDSSLSHLTDSCCLQSVVDS